MTFKESDVLKGADPAKVVLVTELEVEGAPATTSRNLLYFKKTKDLQLPKPEIKLAVAAGANGALTVSVGAKQLARNVFLASGADRRLLRRQLLRRAAGRDRDGDVQAARRRRRRRRCRPR